MLGVLPFVEDLDLSWSAAPVLPQHLPLLSVVIHCYPLLSIIINCYPLLSIVVHCCLLFIHCGYHRLPLGAAVIEPVEYPPYVLIEPHLCT